MHARFVRVKGVMTKELKGPGPPHVTKLDLARAHAKAAGLTPARESTNSLSTSILKI